MSWWDQLLAKVKESNAAVRTRRRVADWDGIEMTPELELRQPFSDGSEEFSVSSCRRTSGAGARISKSSSGWASRGVLAGVGVAVWLKKSKRRKSWRQIFEKITPPLIVGGQSRQTENQRRLPIVE
jgi:hypothetical protein